MNTQDSEAPGGESSPALISRWAALRERLALAWAWVVARWAAFSAGRDPHAFRLGLLGVCGVLLLVLLAFVLPRPSWSLWPAPVATSAPAAEIQAEAEPDLQADLDALRDEVAELSDRVEAFAAAPKASRRSIPAPVAIDRGQAQPYTSQAPDRAPAPRIWGETDFDKAIADFNPADPATKPTF